MRHPTQAKGIPGQSSGRPTHSSETSSPLDDFRLSLSEQIGGSLERILRLRKAEDVAGRFDRKRSTVYRWAAEPGDVPISALTILGDLDPDPEFLARVAGILMSHSSAKALAREAAGRSTVIVQEISPGRWVR